MSGPNAKAVQGFDADDHTRPVKPAGYVSTRELQLELDTPDVVIAASANSADLRWALQFCCGAIHRALELNGEASERARLAWKIANDLGRHA